MHPRAMENCARPQAGNLWKQFSSCKSAQQHLHTFTGNPPASQRSVGVVLEGKEGGRRDPKVT